MEENQTATYFFRKKSKFISMGGGGEKKLSSWGGRGHTFFWNSPVFKKP
jgi:hypothetical protein